MNEALVAELPDIQTLAERRANTKTKLATAAVLGGLGVAGFFAEKYGWVHSDWPPPMHSLKHPWIGYYSAWLADKVFKKFKKTAAVTSGFIANTAAKAVQTAVYRPDESQLHWFHGPHRFEVNSDVASDYVVCFAGTAAYLKQAKETPGFIRYGVHQLLGRFSMRANSEASK